jgi:small subunit ribosomal protein S6
MLKQYETVFIMTPVLSEDQMKETVRKFENILSEKGAEMIHQENWGLKRLEYQIQKKSTGFYQLFEFKAEPHVVAELELQYRREERIMRYLTVTLDKDAIAYAEKRRTHHFGQKKETKPEMLFEIKPEPKVKENFMIEAKEDIEEQYEIEEKFEIEKKHGIDERPAIVEEPEIVEELEIVEEPEREQDVEQIKETKEE